MAEKAFEKITSITAGGEPDIGLSLLGTDLFIMKGDRENAEKQLMLLKGTIEQNPLYKPIYEHRQNSFKLMTIKQDMVEHNWTEGDLCADNIEGNWTEGDLSKDETKTPGAETGVKGEEKEIGSESGVADKKKDIGQESGVKGEAKDIGQESGVKGEEKEIGQESGVPDNVKDIGVASGIANRKKDITAESGVKSPSKEIGSELGEKIAELKKLRENMQALVDQHKNNATFAESMAEIDETAGEIEHAMEMYQKVLDVNPENEKAKIQYSDVAFKADKLDNFRDYIYEQVEKDPHYEVSLDFIREMNKKAVAYINNKENQRFKEGVQIYEDLLAWINKCSP
jgi:tetratricopeptide (TPR) repeat protein